MTGLDLDERTERLRVGGPGVAWRETGDEIVVLDLEGSVYFGLNGTAAALWRRLAPSASRTELVELLQGLGAGPERAHQDVAEFLARLAGYGLLAREPAAAAGRG